MRSGSPQVSRQLMTNPWPALDQVVDLCAGKLEMWLCDGISVIIIDDADALYASSLVAFRESLAAL